MSDNLVVTGIEFDAAKVAREIERLDRQLSRMENQLDSATRKANATQSAFDGLAGKVLKLAAAYGAFRVAENAASFVFKTNVEFQKLEATLNTVTGSVERGRAAFDMITQFASSTPFEVQNLTQAFIALRVRGMDPSIEQMRGLGNFASAFTRDITEVTDAVVSAAAGQSETLRRLGIDATREGDQITLSFQGVTKTVRGSAAEISKFIADIGNSRFGDAMSDRMKTLDGALSNLKDSASLLAKEIGDAGLNGEINGLVRRLDDAIKQSDGFAQQLGEALAAGVHNAGEAAIWFGEHLDTIIFGLEVLTGAAIARGIGTLAARLGAAAVAAGGLSAALSANAVGITLAAIGALTGVLFHLERASDDAAPKIRVAREEIDRMRDSLSKLSEGDAETHAQKLTEHLQDLGAQLAVLKSERDRLRNERLQGAQDRPGRAGVSDFLSKRVPEASHAERELDAALQSGGQAFLQVNAAIVAARQRATAAGTEAAAAAADAADKLREKVKGLVDGFNEQRIALEQTAEAALRYRLTQDGITGALQNEAVAAFNALEAAKAKQKASDEAVRAEQQRREAIERVINGLIEQNKKLYEGEEGLIRYTLQQNKATEAEIERALSLHRLNKEEEDRVRKQEEATREAERKVQAEMDAHASHMESVADRMAGSISDSFVDIIDGTKSVSDAFHEMVSEIEREIIRLLIKTTVTDNIKKIFEGLFSVGVTAAGGGGAGLPIPADPIFGGFAATGGPVDGGKAYVVGELGPELFIPRVSGSIVPNNRLGGPTYVIHEAPVQFSIQALDARSVADILDQHGPLIAMKVLEVKQQNRSYAMALTSD